jgi:hypothetical protein
MMIWLIDSEPTVKIMTHVECECIEVFGNECVGRTMLNGFGNEKVKKTRKDKENSEYYANGAMK